MQGYKNSCKEHFKSRTIFGKDFPSGFQIWGQNFKYPTFRVLKSCKPLLFRRLFFCVGLFMDMTAFPCPIFKSRTTFGNHFPNCFQIWDCNFKFLTFRVCKSWKTLLFRKSDMGRQSYPSITSHKKSTF